MLKSFRVAVGLVALCCLAGQAAAQSDKPFPDIKKNHWAYEALTYLKTNGLLFRKGYGGSYLYTRDEFAEAVTDVVTKLENLSKGVDAEVADVNLKIAQLGRQKPTEGQLQDLLAILNDLVDEAQGSKDLAESTQKLKKLAKAFEPEIKARGGDLKSINRDLDRLNKRFRSGLRSDKKGSPRTGVIDD